MKKSITIPVPAEMHKKLRSASKETGLTIIQLVRLCILNSLDTVKDRIVNLEGEDAN